MNDGPIKRQGISKAVRFEVFKRDSFTCQYCGSKAPDVLLEIDHIHPVAKGGANEILNLLAAGKSCNSGKRDQLLSETAIISKQRGQLEELQLRREQLDMMFEWQRGLVDLGDEAVEQLAAHWAKVSQGYGLTEVGRQQLRKLVGKYSIEEILRGMSITTDQYLQYQGDRPTTESAQVAWQKLRGVCGMNRLEVENPAQKRLYYIRGIVRNRLHYSDDRKAITLLRVALLHRASIESLESFALRAENWTEWVEGMNTFISENPVAGTD